MAGTMISQVGGSASLITLILPAMDFTLQAEGLCRAHFGNELDSILSVCVTMTDVHKNILLIMTKAANPWTPFTKEWPSTTTMYYGNPGGAAPSNQSQVSGRSLHYLSLSCKLRSIAMLWS
jgi:hypothetical protein